MKIKDIDKIHQFSVPSPWSPPGPCNCYLIEDENLTLIDTGPNTKDAYEYLTNELAGIGYSFEDIRNVVITHAHVDHFGLATEIQRRSNASVSAHVDERSRLEATLDDTQSYIRKMLDFFKSTGMPASILEDLERSQRKGLKFAESVQVTNPLEDGDLLALEKFEIEVIHCPGHTMGMIGLYDRNSRLLFSGDHVIKEITPVPLLQPEPVGSKGRFKSLVQYMKSLERIRGLEIDCVLPAHGDIFTEVKKWIDDFFALHQTRKSDMGKIVESAEKTAYDICKEYFGELSGNDVHCGISEVISHMELFHEEGLLNIKKDNGIFYFKMKKVPSR